MEMKFNEFSDTVSTYIGLLTACVLIRLFQLTQTLNMKNIVIEEFHKHATCYKKIPNKKNKEMLESGNSVR